MRKLALVIAVVLSNQALAGTGYVTRKNFGFIKPSTNSSADVNVVLFYAPTGSYSIWSVTYWPGLAPFSLRFLNTATGKCLTYSGDYPGASVFQSTCDANNPNQRFSQFCGYAGGHTWCQVKSNSGWNCASAPTPFPVMIEQPLTLQTCQSNPPDTQLWEYPAP